MVRIFKPALAGAVLALLAACGGAQEEEFVVVDTPMASEITVEPTYNGKL